jgi:hypothetical protein
MEVSPLPSVKFTFSFVTLEGIPAFRENIWGEFCISTSGDEKRVCTALRRVPLQSG